MTGTHPLDLFDLDDLVGDEERAIQQTVREVMDKQVRPHVAQWYDEASLPARELAVELGKVGLLGMHLGLRLRGHQRHGVRPGLPRARGR